MTYPYEQQPSWGPQGPSGNNPNTGPKLGVVIAVAVIVVAIGIGAAFAFTGGDSKNDAGKTSSLTPPPNTGSLTHTPIVPTGSTPTSTTSSTASTSTAPSKVQATGARAHMCSMPAGSTAAPSLVAPGVLATILGHDSFKTPAYKYTTKESSSTLNSYCYNNVKQFDLVLALSYLDGAGYTQTDGKVPDQQQIFRTSNTLTPKVIAITVTGTLLINEDDFDDNVGSVEIDWE